MMRQALREPILQGCVHRVQRLEDDKGVPGDLFAVDSGDQFRCVGANNGG